MSNATATSTFLSGKDQLDGSAGTRAGIALVIVTCLLIAINVGLTGGAGLVVGEITLTQSVLYGALGALLVPGTLLALQLPWPSGRRSVVVWRTLLGGSILNLLVLVALWNRLVATSQIISVM